MAEVGFDINLALDRALRYYNQRLTRDQYVQKVQQTQISAYGGLQSLFENFQTQLNNLNDAFGATGFIASVDDSTIASANVTNSNIGAGVHSLIVTHLAQAAIKNSDAVITTRTGNANITGTLTLTNVNNATTAFSVDVTATDSLEQIRDKINNANDNIGITASIVNTTDDNGNNKYVLILTAKTGTANDFTMTGSAATALSMQSKQAAQDADITLDGFRVVRSSNIIDDALDGLTINLSKEGTTNVKVTSKQSTVNADIKDKLTKFLTSYNQVITYLDANQAVTLYGDEKNPQNTATAMNTSFQLIKARIESAMNTPFNAGAGISVFNDIGIKYSGMQKIQDQFDSKKVVDSFGSLELTAATFDGVMTNKFDQVKNFFTNTNGFLATIKKALSDSILNKADSGMITSSLSNLNKIVSSTGDKISAESDQIDKLRSDLILQFSTINATLQKLQNESEFLTKQYDYLGSLVKNK